MIKTMSFLDNDSFIKHGLDKKKDEEA